MIKDAAAVASFLENAVREFTDIAVVGISGGVDSSVVASICVAALGKENVHLVSMPYDDTDRETFNSRSATLADQLGARHDVVPVGAASDAVTREIASIFSDEPLDILTLANVRPRVRMNILYSISGELGYKTGKRVRVMGTGHLSEDIIGYDTKGGDALCDIFILAELVKSEVYQLAKHYDVPAEIIDAEPSAGLYEGQTDAEELGYTYDELEKPSIALFELLESGVNRDEITGHEECFSQMNEETVQFVISRYRANAHKHEAPATVSIRRQEWFD